MGDNGGMDRPAEPARAAIPAVPATPAALAAPVDPSTTAAPPDLSIHAWPTDADVRLVAADMDGTLLDGDGRIPDGLWPVLAVMRERGITFAPASGRQYATLRAMFDAEAQGMTFIAENGSLVVRDGVEVSSTPLDTPTVREAVAATRRVVTGGADAGVVVCGKRSAYVERTDERFLAVARPYYRELARVPDVLTLSGIDDDIIKVAVYDFDDVVPTARAVLGPFEQSHQVVISGRHWADIMTTGVDKGTALEALQRTLGVDADQTVSFGDFPNDLGLLRAAGLSFAMANGHPDVLAAARFTAPANTQDGVVRVLWSLLGLG